MKKGTVITGMILVVIAIILGAFGAHALKESLDSEKISSFETGVRYQMYHGLALIVLGFNEGKLNLRSRILIRLMVAGVLLFSCSIYLLAIQPIVGFNLKFLGPVTPIGGVLMITAWVMLIIHLLNDRQLSED